MTDRSTSPHFFVMEYLPGGDLREAVLGKRLAPEAVVPLMQEVAAALSAAHERNVFHRDVKPANILLDAGGRPRLTDFDLVRAVDTTGGTTLGGGMGTFLYTAPEAISAPQKAGAAADLYSLAMTAAFCFSGADLPIDVLRDAGSFLRRLPCSAGVQAVLQKAAAWEPESRYASVADFAKALAESHATPTQVEAGSESRPRPPRRPAASARKPLPDLLEKKLPGIPEPARAAAILQMVEEALSVDPQDLATLGLAAWALDYFPGRSPVPAERAAAGRLRDSALADLRERFPPPAAPGAGDPAWAAIPGGSFIMGTPEGQAGDSDEQPAHRVTLSPFRLLVHPVTKCEYRRLDADHSGDANLPASRITWSRAYAYAAWLGGRLPTEAEWEYAARAGCRHAYCARTGSPTTLDKVGWHDGNSGLRLHPVEQLEPNPWGLFDMYGNVWEWVADWYGAYSAEAQVDPWGPPGGERRVLRGGSSWNDAGWARAAYRSNWDPDFVNGNQGFRVVLPAGPEP